MNIEAVILTGGASRRMGSSKARLLVHGKPMAERIAAGLHEHVSKVTVLGREPIDGCDFLADQEDYAGPLVALSRFVPRADIVFVVSCDLPRFDGKLVDVLVSLLDGAQAVVPELDGHRQPLCAIYDARAWDTLHEVIGEGQKGLMSWLDRIECHVVHSNKLARLGIDERSLEGANTPDEFAHLIAD